MLKLIIALAGYYFIHSLLADGQIKQLLQRQLIPLPYYRLFYSAASVVLLLPIAWLFYELESHVLFTYPLIIHLLGYLMMATGLILVQQAMKNYNTAEFIGTYQLKYKKEFQATRLNKAGLNALVRHPLYFASLLIFWGVFLVAPTTKVLAIAAVTTLYLLIGIRLEERKLVKAFGNAYQKYQTEVPMLLPLGSRKRN